MKLKLFFGTLLYKCIGRHLPTSFSKVKIGQKKFRGFCAKLIMKSAGKNINVEKGAVFSREVSLGDNSGIGVNCVLNGCVEIGKDVMMGPNCTFYTRNHAFQDCTVPMNVQGFVEEKKIIVGDDVWIGGHAIILPGVTIGAHSIVGAGAVVTKDVPEWAIVAGNPATVKGKRQ